MPLDLPTPDATQLSRSPLELVVCQIRFDSSGPRTSADVLRFHGLLGGGDGQYPTLEPVQTLNLLVGIGGPETSQSPGWRLINHQTGWAVSLMSDHVSLETQNYETWMAFRERLAEVIDAVVDVLQPTFVLRLGLRYIDRITELNITSPAGWKPYIQPWLLGFATEPTLSNLVQAAQQQLVISLGDAGQCGLRHGLLTEPGKTAVDYLLDYDLYRQEARPFDADALKVAADDFNHMALQLFQASVTPKLLKELGKS